MLTAKLQAGSPVRQMLLGRLDPWPDELRGEEMNAVPPHLCQMALLKLHLRTLPPVRRSAISQSAPVRTGTLDYQPR